MYNWQLSDWPNFTFDRSKIKDELLSFVQDTGRLNGWLEAIPSDSRNEAMLEIMLSEAINTSEIEGEFLSREDVMSSIKRNLGLNPTIKEVKDLRAQGIAELVLAIRTSFDQPLTKETLFALHQMIMKGNMRINTGQWRFHHEPMQVVSGAIGREVVHFEAPPSAIVPKEMEAFIRWFNNTAPGGSLEISNPSHRAAIVHLYFETIHPFEDGNGRIGRAISEKALSQSLGHPVFLSLSRTIVQNKKAYYEALKKGQRSNDITGWINYFQEVIMVSQQAAHEQIKFLLKKTKYLDLHRSALNERQMKVILRILKEGPEGFEGGITAKKYMTISKTSKATATRDLQDMLSKKMIKTNDAKGRSTSYRLVFE
ncbi:MAG: Fic family protein [Cyclobacteriaceae bacterium]